MTAAQPDSFPPGFWWEWFGKDKPSRNVDFPEVECLGIGAHRRYSVNGIPMLDKDALKAALFPDDALAATRADVQHTGDLV